jgi:hypothetical protein
LAAEQLRKAGKEGSSRKKRRNGKLSLFHDHFFALLLKFHMKAQRHDDDDVVDRDFGLGFFK